MKLVNVHRPVYRTNPIDHLLNDFFNANEVSDRLAQKELNYSPLTNVIEGNDKIVLELVVPGFEKDQIQLSVEKNILSVKSNLIDNEVEGEDKKNEPKYSRVEFQKRNFEKKFRLSDQLDQEKISADFKNGILTITMAKKEEAIPVKRQIEIG